MSEIKVELLGSFGSDRIIAETAWTSSFENSTKEFKTDADVKRIVNMLADLKHSVPFESVVYRFWYRLPIQTDRQHVTHRIASHSGMSGRYRTMPEDWLDIAEDVSVILSRLNISGQVSLDYEFICSYANKWYREKLEYFKKLEKKELISNSEYKRLREFFRGVLPQNNMTERVSVFNLRSLANYIKLRSKSDAQVEIQFIANEMVRLIKQDNICPVAIEALERNGWII